jgi:fluoride exporter
VSAALWWLAVAAGGAVGTAARVGWLIAVPTRRGAWPTTVLLENVLGALALGLVLGLAARGRAGRSLASPFFTTGVLGSFTTFSSLAGGMLELPVPLAVAYGASSLVLGLMAAAIGWRVGRGTTG